MDPITLTSVGTVVISKGVKFLYNEATDLLKRWKDRKEKAEAPNVEPAQITLPAQVFEGQMQQPQIHFDALGKVQTELLASRSALTAYVDGLQDIDPHNQEFVASVEALRELLEAVYQQRITFKGENREPSGPVVEGSIDVEKVLGDVAGVRAGQIKSGKVTGTAKVKEAAAGSVVSGVDVDTVGDS